MKQSVLKIGEVARLIGISPSTIRGWESLGLTHPRRSESKYRLYTNEDVKLLRSARYLRKVHRFNLAAIVLMFKRVGVIRHSPKHANGSMGPRLRQLRTKRQLSLAEVATAVGVSVGFLSAIERSQMNASVGTLRRLERYYAGTC